MKYNLSFGYMAKLYFTLTKVSLACQSSMMGVQILLVALLLSHDQYITTVLNNNGQQKTDHLQLESDTV